MTLSEILGGVQKVATTGTQVYNTVTGTQLRESPAPQPAASTPSAGVAAALPWYKAAWVIPAAVVAGLLVVVALIRGSRR